MADMTADQALTRQQAKAPQGQAHMVNVAKSTGVGPFAQMVQMMGLKRAPNLITANEYYDFQLYRPSLTKAQKREFVGEKASFALNLKLAPPSLTHMRGFLADKAALTSLFGAWGLPTTKLRAVYSPDRSFGSLTTLRDAEAVAGWLRAQSDFPIFGKPARGAQALGSVRINAVAGDVAQLANGRSVPVAQLAEEIAGNTAHGFVFQDVVAQHPDVTDMIGSETVSTLRLVTVVEESRPRLLYAVWKLGSAKAMSDNFWQAGSLICHVDATSGTVLKARLGSGTATKWVDSHPQTGVAIVGRRVPNFDKAVAVALEAHGAFPVNGILGWDIALTKDGACLIECNENTGHALYQYAADRGVLNEDFRPVFDRIVARNAAMGAAHDARRKAYQSAKSRF